MKDRIRTIMETYHLTQQQFAQKLGLGAATISSIFTGRTKPTNNHVQAIHKEFPEISTNWVLFGEGEMLISEHPAAASDSPAGESGGGEEMGFNLGEGSVAFSPDMDSPSLFPEIAIPSSASSASTSSYARSQSPAAISPAALKAQLQMVQMAERAPRKIKEIRVFFDDGTFEVFSPSNK